MGGLGVLGFDALGCGGDGSPAQPGAPVRQGPTGPSTSAVEAVRAQRLPHRALMPGGVIGYADRLSVAPGETINFHVSNDAPYTIGIYRLGSNENDPTGDVQMPDFPTLSVSAAAVQPIHPGSYVHIPNKLTVDDAPEAFTVECWVRAQDVSRHAGLVTQYDFPKRCGFGLFLYCGGAVGFYLGDGGEYNTAHRLSTLPGALVPGEWCHIVGRWDGMSMSIWINGVQKVSRARSGEWDPGTEELRLAAHGANGVASQFLDGDLAMPVLYSRALTQGEIQARARDRAATIPTASSGVLAAWPLTEEKGAVIADGADADGEGRNGRIVNHATWQIGGPRFNFDVPRYPGPGETGAYEPATDRTRGHGLRFSSDDLYDCEWSVTHSYRIPADAKSGFYVARFRYPLPGKNYYHISFVVTKAAARPKSDILLLTPTNTFIAYNSKPFRGTRPGLVQIYGSSHRTDEPLPEDEPGHSAYTPHQSNAPAFNMGLRVPMPSFDPYNRYVLPDYGHLMQPVRAIQSWLESSGYSYDVATDLDLHNDPELLAGYKTVIIPGHSEYWTIPAYEGVKSYLAANGNVLVLSGNTMFWRVSFDPTCTVMECRKADFGSAGRTPARRGEIWHSDDGLRGGLMRECGYPAYPLLGLETFAVLNPSVPASFSSVEEPGHFLFDGVDLVGFGKGLAGHEIDARISTLEESRIANGPGVPATATAPIDDTDNLVTLASASGGQATALYDYFGREMPLATTASRGDLVYWERPAGGKVVNVGSIRAGLSLKTDPAFAAFVKNVLRHFDIAVPG